MRQLRVRTPSVSLAVERFQSSQILAAAMLLFAAALGWPAPAGAVTFDYEHWLSFLGDAVEDPKHPLAGLVQGDDNYIYGSTRVGGADNCGTLFRFNESGPGTIETIHEFSGEDGCIINSALVAASDRSLYGITQQGGEDNGGTLFKVELGEVVGDPVTVTVLHHLDRDVDGWSALGSLLEASDGYIYGTAAGGGANDDGTVFRIHPNGDFAVLHAFGVAAGDPKGPDSSLIQATDGFFYGTTVNGGQENAGTIYRMDTAGHVTILLSFEVGGELGTLPVGGLVQTGPSTFYGTTTGYPFDPGTIFKLDTSSMPVVATLVHQFVPFVDGFIPTGSLLLAGDGNIYGTTLKGGAVELGGVVFRLDPDDDQLTVLHEFDGDPIDMIDTGVLPWAGLMQDISGQLWGTTSGYFLFENAAVDPGTIFTLRADLSGIEHKEQTITFGPLADQAVGAADFVVAATASSGLKVRFSADGDCTNSGVWIHLTGEGICTITASQLGDAYYDPAPEVQQSFDIIPAVTLSLLPVAVNGGTKSVGTVTLTMPAPAAGAIVNLSSGNPAVASVPATLSIGRGQTKKTFNITTFGVATSTPVNISASFSGTIATQALTVNGPVVSEVKVSLGTVTGGTPATGTVKLDGPAGPGGTSVTLASSRTDAAQVSSLVVVPAGQTSATFPIITSPVASSATAAISATCNGVTKSANLSVTPAAISALSLNPAKVKGGVSSTATVTLNGPAPTGGLLVTLTSSKTNAAASTSVTVGAGTTSATVAITTFAVTKDEKADITASAGGGGLPKKATLTVTK